MNMKKILAFALCLVLVAGLSIAGTIAWLQDKTEEIKNTFTVGNIDIELTETFNKDTNNDGTADAWEKKMVPGITLEKNPTVTVTANSEDSYVFVKVTESDNLDTFIAYTIADGWIKLEEGVYYREYTLNTADQEYAVLANNKVTVKDTVTQTNMNTLTDADKYPTLTFKAYAIQKTNGADGSIFTPAAAWAEVKD